MFEISIILFTLLVEGFIALLLLLIVLLFLQLKRRKKDKQAAQKLVKQIQQQSKTRLQNTGSFLSEKYGIEGNDLEKAVTVIDKAEKKYMQKLINMYLQRDSHALTAMDACIAELIEAYKELSPVMPDAEMSTADPAQIEEINQLRDENEKLTEELSITKQTMGNMIHEFGNMFGGGQENQVPDEDVLDKVNIKDSSDEKDGFDNKDDKSDDEQDVEFSVDSPEIIEDQLDESKNETVSIDEIDDLLDQEDLMDELIISEEEKADVEKKKKVEKQTSEVFDEGIDDLMDGIDLSDDELSI